MNGEAVFVKVNTGGAITVNVAASLPSSLTWVKTAVFVTSSE